MVEVTTGVFTKMIKGLIAINLSNEDAELFKQFMQYHDKIQFLIENQCLDIKRGSATINFSKEGEILSVDRHLYTYSSKSDKY